MKTLFKLIGMLVLGATVYQTGKETGVCEGIFHASKCGVLKDDTNVIDALTAVEMSRSFSKIDSEKEQIKWI